MSKTKIIVAGIGAVGGFFGGKLAAHYASSEEVDVYFLARGKNEQVIKEQGLKLETTKGNFHARPEKVSSHAEEFGRADFILCCTKSYDLEQTIVQLKPCIDQDTVILPLLNGVDTYESIKKVLPENEIWDGCVYIVSRLAAPGLIRETGNITLMDFGSRNGSTEKLQQFEQICRQAGVEARLSPNIVDTIWKKYSFIATVASLTSYLDSSIGEILSRDESKKMLHALLEELQAVATAQGITLPEDIVQKNIDIMASLPPETTSSMHTDYLNGKKTEVESITGYMVKLGKKLDVPTPTFDKVYAALLEKSPQNKV